MLSSSLVSRNAATIPTTTPVITSLSPSAKINRKTSVRGESGNLASALRLHVLEALKRKISRA